MPPSLFNRLADNWHPLFAVADAAGDGWPVRARKAAEALIRAGNADGDQSTRILLLRDLRTLFDADVSDGLFSDEIVQRLSDLEERPWSEYSKGRPITKAQLARLLRPFKISPGTLRRGTKTAKGYRREAFDDAFARYLPDESVTTSQAVVSYGSRQYFDPSQARGCDGSDSSANPQKTTVCDSVTDNSSLDQEERAAILQYDGGYPRAEAERLARNEPDSTRSPERESP